MKIRDAVYDDLPAIVEIYNSTIPGRMVTADTEPVTVQSRHDWFYEHTPDHRPLWVMECDGQIAGWLSYQNFYGRPAYSGTAELSIYISHDFRRHGIGRILLAKALDECPKLGIHALLGFIFGHNDPSLKLFEQFGFTRWGHLPKVAYLDDTQRDLIIMGRHV